VSIKNHAYMRMCSKCKQQKLIRGGYVSPRLFLCADCRKKEGK